MKKSELRKLIREEILKLNEEENISIQIGLIDISAAKNDRDASSYYKKMYGVKLGKITSSTKGVSLKSFSGTSWEGSQKVTGTKKEIFNFLTGDEPYGFTKQEVLKAHPELK